MGLWQWVLDNWALVWTYLYVGIDVVLRLISLVVVPRNRRPGSALAWLLAIMVLPIVGFPLFLLLGRSQLPKRRLAKQKAVNRLLRVRAHEIPDSELDEDAPSWLQSAVQLNRELGAFPLTGNNSAELEIDYDTSIARMAEDIRTARESVHVLFYIMGLDEVTEDFFEALAERADAGVTVRVLYDHWGAVSHRAVYRAMRQKLDAHGIQHAPMMPIHLFRDGAFQRPDLRNHRKMVIVDGEIGWMGSQNLIAAHYDKPANIRRGLHWQETMARFRGPIVSELNLLFASDWYYESDEMLDEQTLVRPSPDTSGTYECQLVPSGPGFVAENNLLLFNQLFYSAARRIVAVSPYFVPDESMLSALITAARRGVEVELFVSEIGDQFLVFHAQRSYYSVLLEAGVTIWLYRAPTILHAKHVTIDDSVSVIGSSNMDMRSFGLNYESTMLVARGDLIDQLNQLAANYRGVSHELTLEEWNTRGFFRRYVDNVMRLTSALQ